MAVNNIYPIHKDLPNLPEQLAGFGKVWGRVLTAGIFFGILGVFAMSWPVSSTIGLTLTLGAIFMVAGVLQAVHAVQLRKEAGNSWRIFQAIAAFAAGFLMLRFPASGMIGVAIALTFYFFVSAIAKAVVAFAIRPLRGWGWTLASAIASACLGAYIVGTLPFSALWVPGFTLGIDFFVYGLSLVAFSLELRRVHQRIEQMREAREISDSKVAKMG